MGRIRSIKPEFPQSESVGRLSRDARLLFIQLWTLVDDEGRTRGASRMLASLLYPYDTDAPSLIETWLDELGHEGHIRRYEVDGHTYLEVLNFLEHQKIDRPSKSKIPTFGEASTNPREDSPPDQGRDQGSRIKEGIEGEGEPPAKSRDKLLGGMNGNASDTVDTRILSESVGIFGMREQAEMNRLLAVHMKETGRNVVESVGVMIARWEEYQTAMPSLEWNYGSSYRFFMSGNWNHPEIWPRAGAKLTPKEAARKAFEERNRDEDEAD